MILNYYASHKMKNDSPQNDSPQNDSPQNDSPQNDSPQNEVELSYHRVHRLYFLAVILVAAILYVSYYCIRVVQEQGIFSLWSIKCNK